jgi:outer membrane immunogenic protein
MKKLMKTFGLIVAAVSVLANHAALAQKGSITTDAAFQVDRSNLVVGCNCFRLYGGAAELQFGVAEHMSVLGSVAAERQTSLTPDGYGLTQSTYLAGLRLFPLAGPGKLRPFGDVALGLAHAGGSLSPAKTGYGSSNAFAMELGGGAELRLSQHWVLVPVEADYLLTTFSNGGTNRQNQLRLSAGVSYRWRNGR